MNGPIMPLLGVRRRAVLPRPIRTLVRKLPRVPSSAVVAAVLNLMVRRRLPVTVFEHLGDRPFSIEVRDADLVMAFRYSGRRFVPVPVAGEAALRFRVNASDFATLAAPENAPDDGYFLHDLVVVGDPDIAAEVHRALEGIDIVRTRRILRRALRMAQREAEQG
jgi:predicted lipid carrier protein YhbT